MSKKYIFRPFIIFSALVLLVTLLGVSPVKPTHAAAPLRIMALGDSITGSPGCWRAILWNKLIANGFTNFVPVGTLPPAGCANDIANDNHEGHGGFLATGIANQNQLPGWLAASTPDIVVMHLGTNDSFSASNTVDMILAAYTTLVGQMRASNPNMKILVAQIIPLYTATGQCPVCYQDVVNLDAAIPSWAAGLSTTQSPIIVVDQWTGFDTTTDTGDGIHPNDLGIQKIADRWYPALAAVLNGSTPTPSITPGGPTLTPTRTSTITNTPTITMTPTITNTPVIGMQVKLQNAGTETNSLSSFNLQFSNTGTSLSNLSWRLYFNTENSNAASTYTLEKYYDQSGIATLSGPTLACGSTYYYTVSYGTTALTTGTTWAYNTGLHLSSYASTYDASNDWWHSGYAVGSLPAAYTADTYFPVYVNGSRITGNEPNCSGSVTNTPTRTITPTSTTVTNTPTRTNTAPAITLTPTRTNTAGITNTPTRTSTLPAITNTPTRTFTPPAITITPTRTLSPTATPTFGTGTCSPVTSTITAPFTFDGAGTFCWQSTNLGTYTNNWNTTSVSINGVSISNVYFAAASYPAKIGGFWYVSYSSAVTFGHFEAK